MNEENQGPKFYGPAEAAKYLQISQTVLARLRRDGKVQGTRSGTTTIYTQEQLDAADLSRSKPGPKVGEGSRLGRAKYEWPEDGKQASKSSSLGYTDSEGGDFLSNRWRICDKAPASAPEALLVGV